MLKQILDDTKLEPAFCASLIGVSSEQLGEWVSGRESLPRFVIPELSSILGIPADELSAAANKSPGERGSMSTIWYKLRDEKLTEADREMVGIVRKLGFYYHQLQELAEGEVIGHKRLLSAVRRKVDSSAPAEVQGGAAAQAVRNAAGFNQGQGGIGELIRPYLRRMGLLVVESPLRGSLVEGCSFVVASAGVDTPCIFTNSYKAGWFRRNVVVMHELGHIIFDVEDDQVRLDYQGGGLLRIQRDPSTGFCARVFGSEISLDPLHESTRPQVGCPDRTTDCRVDGQGSR